MTEAQSSDCASLLQLPDISHTLPSLLWYINICNGNSTFTPLVKIVLCYQLKSENSLLTLIKSGLTVRNSLLAVAQSENYVHEPLLQLSVW